MLDSIPLACLMYDGPVIRLFHGFLESLYNMQTVFQSSAHCTVFDP